MTTRTLPAAFPVRNMISDLIGREVDVAPGDHVTGIASVAVYVTDQMRMAGLALLDLPLSAYIGGALALLPAGGVADMVEEGELSALVEENVFEVANVLAGIFNTRGAPHVRLFRVYEPGEALPADVRDAAAMYGARLDLVVSIAGYGKGALSLVAVD
jgi:hypothetical protein